MDKEMKRRFFFYSAIIDIVQIFGEAELGSCEVDEESIVEYCMSYKFSVDNYIYNVNTKEDMYQKITDDILNGMPVWEFLKVSDWTKRMFEKSFVEEKELKYYKLCKKYKCYTCQYYKASETDIGVFEKCIYKNRVKGEEYRTLTLRERGFVPKGKCVNYKQFKK